MIAENDSLRIIRDQIAFLAIFFSCFGIIFFDSYYTTFGIKYYTMQIPAFHFIYKGATAPLWNMYLIPCVLFLLSGVALTYVNAFIVIFNIKMHLRRMGILIIALSPAVGLLMSFISGSRAAILDMYVNSTTLRQMISFYSSDPQKNNTVNEMLREGPVIILMQSNSMIILFHPPAFEAMSPRIEMTKIGVSNGDVYSDKIPDFR